MDLAISGKRIEISARLAVFLVLWAVCVPQLASQDRRELEKRLEELPLVSYNTLPSDTPFVEKFDVFMQQPVDHHDVSTGVFNQRFIVGHRGFDRPVVFVTEGYSAAYATFPRYLEELCSILDANVICVEHRYFDKSVPDPPDWKYLTVENAANDHHRVISLMKSVYPGKWISTGISKGGQTALFHRSFFPEDVDVTVGYVCPLNFSTEDLRVYRFLDQVADSACRKKVRDFQVMMLEKKPECLPVFEKLAAKKNLHFRQGTEWGYELMAMEYSFAFFQWGIFSCDQIPGKGSSCEEIIMHLDDVAGLDWVADEGIESGQPFFYQALTEIGMYGYDLSEFDGFLDILKSGTFEFTCPKGCECIYDPLPMQRVDHFVRHEAERMIFIYGEWDPWSAPAVQWSGNPGVEVIIKPRGNHRTRIVDLPEYQQDKVYELLEDWLGMEVRRLN